MRIRVVSNIDIKVVVVSLMDVVDKIVGVFEEIGSGSRVDGVFFFFGRVFLESEDVGNVEVFIFLIVLFVC